MKRANFELCSKKYKHGKIPKLPRRNEIWATYAQPDVEWLVTGVYKVTDMYSLAMSYPGYPLDTLIVTCVNISDSCKTFANEPLGEFIVRSFMKRLEKSF